MARRMFYVELTRGGRAEICGEGAVHLRKVLRAERGQRYEVSDNETLYLAEIADISKDRVEFELVERIEAPVLPVRLHLLAALVKFDRFEWIIEKATELGVDAITPVVAARSEHGLEDGARKRSDRWRKILFESGQQSRRVTRPELNAVTDLTVALGADGDAKLWMDEQRSGARCSIRLASDSRYRRSGLRDDGSGRRVGERRTGIGCPVGLASCQPGAADPARRDGRHRGTGDRFCRMASQGCRSSWLAAAASCPKSGSVSAPRSSNRSTLAGSTRIRY